LQSGAESFTRVLPFESIVREDYRDILHTHIIQLSGFIREVVVRSQLFVNAYIIDHSEQQIPTYMFSQNFFYSICQLVIGKEISNANTKFPPNVQEYWTTFKSTYPDIIYPLRGFTKYSDDLSAACVTLATIYSNHIVENFHNRIITYCQHRLEQIVPVCIFAREKLAAVLKIYYRTFLEDDVGQLANITLPRLLLAVTLSGQHKLWSCHPHQ
jgi:hypothetical protein